VSCVVCRNRSRSREFRFFQAIRGRKGSLNRKTKELLLYNTSNISREVVLELKVIVELCCISASKERRA
jgi:hypothetical protein